MMKNKCLFLDRDGVINIDTGYTYRIDDIVFVDGIFDLCKTAKDMGYLIIVATNQAGIGRGFYNVQDFYTLTNWLDSVFLQQGITISDTYFCPYHPEHGINEYKSDSFDRKPNPGMLLQAINQHNIDPQTSIMIGDRETDMQAAHSANIKTKVLLTNQPQINTVADYCVNKLSIVKDFL